MAKHRELANVVFANALGQTSASRIWRTVVFAGAMLVTPVVAGCGGGAKKAETTQPVMTEQADPGDKAARDEAAAQAEKAAADKAAEDRAAEEQRLLAEREAADKKAAEELAAKEEADKKAAEEAAAKKPRPRTQQKSRPTGRGFILS